MQVLCLRVYSPFASEPGAAIFLSIDITSFFSAKRTRSQLALPSSIFSPNTAAEGKFSGMECWIRFNQADVFLLCPTASVWVSVAVLFYVVCLAGLCTRLPRSYKCHYCKMERRPSSLRVRQTETDRVSSFVAHTGTGPRVCTASLPQTR